MVTATNKGTRAERLRRLLDRLDARVLGGGARKPALYVWIRRSLELRLAYRRELFGHNPYVKEAGDG